MTDFLKRLFGGASGSVVEDASGLCSHSGFVREAAVKALVSRPQRGTLPILLGRLNDWVPQVRVAAGAAVRSLLRPEFLPEWVASIDAVVALQRARRSDHTAMLNEIARFLSVSEHLPQVVKAAKTAGLHGRRYVFELTWHAEQDEVQRAALLKNALLGKDIVVAALALTRVDGTSSTAMKRGLYEAASASPFGQARYTAVRWLVNHPDETTGELIHRVCLDPLPSVRWWCLYWLRAADDLGPAVSGAVARASDAKIPLRRRIAAMQFLREANPDNALRVSKPWLESEWPQLRREALAIRVAEEGSSDKEQWLHKAFADPALSVQRLLLERESRRVWGPTSEQVWTQFEVSQTPEQLKKLLVLSELHGDWERLHGLLRAWNHSTGSDMDAALLNALKRWRDHSQSLRYRPEERLSQRLARSWADVRHRVPERWRQVVDAKLHAFEIE